MTDTTVTPDLLLFLAGKMGLPEARIDPYTKSRRRVVADETWYSMNGEAVESIEFNPATDPAQFGRLVVWAALNGLRPMLAKRHAFAGLVGTSSDYTQAHDSTEAGIMAAAVVAIARAAGWEAGHEATT